MVNRQADSIRKDIKEIEKIREKLRCSHCGSRNICTTKEGIKVCRTCGYRGK